MVTSMLCGTMSARPAYAQGAQAGATPAGNLLTVIVIDFTNSDRNKAGGEALARFATDAVAVELASSNRFEVLKRDEVARQAADLGYRPPYDQAQLSKIASNLGANAIVTGDIAFVRPEATKAGVTH